MRHDWKSLEIQQKLADLSAQGMSAGDIAERFRCSRSAVASAMHYWGLFARSYPMRARPGRRARDVGEPVAA